METNQQETGPVSPTPIAPTPNNAPSDETLMGVLAYLSILVIVPLVTEARNNPFVKFHIKQGLVLLIAEIIASFVLRVPVLGWIFGPILWLGTIILIAIGIMNVLNKQQKELPLIGHLANKISI